MQRANKELIDIADPTVSDHTIVTRSDIAAYLGVTLITVDRLRKKGIIPEQASPKGTNPRWRAGTIREMFINSSKE